MPERQQQGDSNTMQIISDNQSVVVELITPRDEFTSLFGRQPDPRDVKLGLTRLIEIQKLLRELHHARS